jgi:CubicO group peptidase (beta-lactamase class C family)
MLSKCYLPLAFVCASWLAPLSVAQTQVSIVRLLTPGDLAEKIEAYVQPFIETNNFSGVVCVTRGDRLLFQRGYGKANFEFGLPNTPETRFHIASVSKSFTAAAILLLEERGGLRTSDPVSKFIPDYPNGDKIHLQHLLTHSSGIPNVNSFPEYDRESRFPHTISQVVALFKDKPLDFEPGSRIRYSNSNYNVLALIIEKVSGQPYGEFLKTNIFDPLGLSSIVHDGDATRIIPYCASGTGPDGFRDVKLVPYLDWSIKTGNGSLVTTARDLCKFAGSLFGGRLLKPASLAKVMQPGTSFPYGWSSGERFGHKTMGVGGRSPGFVSSLEYFLEDSTCIAILSNSYSSVAQVIAPDMSAIVFGQPFTSTPIAYVSPRPGELSAFIGRYKMPDDYYVPGATLTLQDRGNYLEANWSNGATTIFYPTGGDNFIDRTFWAQVLFTRGTRGELTGFNYKLIQEFRVKKVTP